jgi:hypothetical protein
MVILSHNTLFTGCPEGCFFNKRELAQEAV